MLLSGSRLSGRALAQHRFKMCVPKSYLRCGIFCLLNYDCFWRISVHLSKMNVVVHIQLTFILSHTWVRYPGFWGHGVKCPILTTVVPGFPAIWLAVPFGANGAHLGICTLPEKNIFCVWNKLFLGEIKFSQSRTRPVKSLWWQIVPMQESTNEWKNLTIFEVMGLAETQR